MRTTREETAADVKSSKLFRNCPAIRLAQMAALNGENAAAGVPQAAREAKALEGAEAYIAGRFGSDEMAKSRAADWVKAHALEALFLELERRSETLGRLDSGAKPAQCRGRGRRRPNSRRNCSQNTRRRRDHSLTEFASRRVALDRKTRPKPTAPGAESIVARTTTCEVQTFRYPEGRDSPPAHRLRQASL